MTDRGEYFRRYRELHKEEIKEYQKTYRKDNPKIKLQCAEWRRKHPGYFKKWKEEHPLYFQIWRLFHPAYFTEYMRRYRSISEGSSPN
ncbi:MAG: hypothetical protein AB1393_11735 [Candidatus Edwardsbacteria bacterium]